MREVSLSRGQVTDVASAREEIIFNLIHRNLINNNSNIIYFDGWSGFGTTAVLRSIAQVLPSMKSPPPKLCFSRTIYIDCSTCTSKRMMQRKIAEELKLDPKAMGMFEEQDEEDDFNGLDHGTRDVIRSVAAVIDKTLRESTFMMIFINGGDDELDLRRFGIPEYHDCVIIWTFSRRFMSMSHPDKISKKLRYTDVFIYCPIDANYLSSSQFVALFHEEAAGIVARYPCMRGMDPTTVVDCWLYGLLLYYSFRSTSGFAWPAHAPNYWICDGIIQGDRVHEISNALHRQISFERDAYGLDGVFSNLKKDPKTPFLVVKDDDDIYKKRPYRWLSVTLRNKKVQDDMQTILAGASSIFLAFETKGSPLGLPNGFFKQCSNLGVLILSCCAFSFISPPFVHCHTLIFLGLDKCTDDNTIELQGRVCTTKWAFLKSLWVIDLYYTDWVEILSEEKTELMANLMELNIEGVRWLRRTSNHQLQKRLPNLRRLRIIRSTYDEAATAEKTSSSGIDDPFLMECNTSLEILDLSSSNRLMGRNLAASISKAIHLQVLILDGCDGLEDVMLSNNFSLRSFSLDGYGPASSHRASTVELPPEMSRPKRPPADASTGKISIVSLQRCGRLDNLFLRGLPNLVELDLSGCAIKVLDFETMVVDVPRLKRLFLLGCKRLRAIRWGSYYEQNRTLELLCIDTRPTKKELGCGRPSLGTLPTSFGLRVHAITGDARLVRSLCGPIRYASGGVYFISITSSTACSGAVVQPEATSSNMMETTDQHHHVAAGMYDDIFTEVGYGMTPMQAFPQPPTGQLNRHIEIGYGSHAVQSEVDVYYSAYDNLARLMTESPSAVHYWHSLCWCRVERCPKLHAVFPPGTEDSLGKLEIIWASDLLMARCIWSQGRLKILWAGRFKSLQHLHLRCCPSLQFALAMGDRTSFPNLETLHIIHCGDLRHIFVPWDEQNQHTSVQFPKLTTIHLHDLPALQQICKDATALAPALETIKIRACWSLRRLPALKGRELDMKKPTVEIEKDVWDALEWDGVEAGHRPSHYDVPVHSRYYKRRLLRRTVLR
ncbi:unnamed protein product [Urochloa decumbens]|uniref:Disease resistance protein At4g27190-like leucine-rich repeats domain-containing protein n=1 Tax=Urochloa decumbens TaxID=240449 RepID=A0ABC9B7M4_9POAL